MKQVAVPYKGYSLKERDRRWQKAREFMKERELDALLVVGGGQALDQYLSNGGGAVIFPVKGEPTLLTNMVGAIMSATPDASEGSRSWIKDMRAGARGAIIAAVLQEKGLDRAHVGVVGIGPLATAWEGWIPWGTWNRVVRRLPNCNFEDVTDAFARTAMAHSEEQLEQFRLGSQILEQASIEMIKMVRPGLNEAQVYAAFLKVVHENGAPTDPGGRWILSGPDNLIGFGTVRWQDGFEKPRVLQAGDIINSEFTAWVGGMQAQVQVAVAIPPISSVNAECARLARLSYEAGLHALRPGKTFEEVEGAMAEAMAGPGVWSQTPLIHSLGPHLCIGRTGIGIEKLPGIEGMQNVRTGHIRGGDVVIQAGMVFEFEPNACIGRNRVNIGGAVVVTDGEPEELNKAPTRMAIAGKP
ncbi:MAG: M24 family metallopeptidase [Chloroflexi bacterium]|nr:M24 family metallopeptidase [Chloroflexota bacterium]